MKKAVFPGSFDPITLGHEDIINRALPLFDEIVIAIGINDAKKYMFTIEERVQFIKDTFNNEPKISVTTYIVHIADSTAFTMIYNADNLVYCY